MNMMIRSIRSTLGKALILCAFALTMVITPAVAVDPKNPATPNTSTAAINMN